MKKQSLTWSSRYFQQKPSFLLVSSKFMEQQILNIKTYIRFCQSLCTLLLIFYLSSFPSNKRNRLVIRGLQVQIPQAMVCWTSWNTSSDQQGLNRFCIFFFLHPVNSAFAIIILPFCSGIFYSISIIMQSQMRTRSQNKGDGTGCQSKSWIKIQSLILGGIFKHCQHAAV